MLKIKIVSAVVAVLAGLAGLALSAAPASAHNHDSYSLWYCGTSRLYGDETIYHSEITAIWPGHLQYYCYGRNAADTHEFQWWVRVNVDTGNWAMDSGYQNCNLIFCREPAEL